MAKQAKIENASSEAKKETANPVSVGTVDKDGKVTLSDGQKSLAIKCMDGFIEAEAHYIKVVTEEEKNLSGYIYSMCLEAAKQSKGDLKVEEAVFAALCSSGERYAKAEYEIDNLSTIAPHWKVYKSQILRNLKAGISSKAHKYLNQQTKAREASEAAKTAAQAPSVARPGNGTASPAPTSEAVAQLRATPASAATLAALVSGTQVSPLIMSLTSKIVRDTAAWTVPQIERFCGLVYKHLAVIGAEKTVETTAPVGVNLVKETVEPEKVAETSLEAMTEAPAAEVMVPDAKEDEKQMQAA